MDLPLTDRARLREPARRNCELGRDFTADIPTGEGWLHLATVSDWRTKEMIGYTMDDHYKPR
ncbi:hypothetical protein [Amycolatopsis sacchari]|uniref:hypothetical protein n=1 Tax=Amycolatopsis sacchari TaxID=115433 RepID=UPI003D74F915